MLAERLTESERSEYENRKRQVHEGIENWVKVSADLLAIRDRRLYREQYKTFEDCCREEFKIGRSHAYRLIEAAQVMGELESEDGQDVNSGAQTVVNTESVSDRSVSPLGTNGKTAPADEPQPTIEQARELAKAPAGTRKKKWKEAQETAPKSKAGKPKVTAAHVRRVVKKRPEPEKLAAPAAPPPQIQLDYADNPIPADLCPVFAQADQHHGEALKLLTRLSGLLNPILGDAKEAPPLPAGRHTAEQRQQILTDVRNLRTALTQTRPHAVCPYCRAKSRAKCPACKGLGWVTKGVWDAAPADMRAELKQALEQQRAA